MDKVPQKSMLVHIFELSAALIKVGIIKVVNASLTYKMPRYRREDRAMRPIAYGCSEKNCESLATPTANFPDILIYLFRSIRKKSCGFGSAVRTPLVCAVCRATTLHGPSYWNKAYL